MAGGSVAFALSLIILGQTNAMLVVYISSPIIGQHCAVSGVKPWTQKDSPIYAHLDL